MDNKIKLLVKIGITMAIWYVTHKYIRIGLNPKITWDAPHELDAQLGALSAGVTLLLKTLLDT